MKLEEQFIRCKEIFVQNKLFIPILITMIIGVLISGFTAGVQITKLQNRITDIERTPILLQNIEKKLDTVIFLHKQ